MAVWRGKKGVGGIALSYLTPCLPAGKPQTNLLVANSFDTLSPWRGEGVVLMVLALRMGVKPLQE
jgi:hypothetical protein